LVPEKGLDVLLRALALIPHATLEVAGAGPLGAQLDAEARRLGLERRVRFWGRLGPAQLAARRRTAWAYVQPSRYEPFGLAALDAAGDGMPLVFSRVGGLAEWGRLVPVRWARPGDATDLARQMTAALLDQDWGCAEAGQRLAVLAWPQVAERMDTVYGPLVEEREGAGPAHGSGFGS
jgi:glycogen(starch) synthase